MYRPAHNFYNHFNAQVMSLAQLFVQGNSKGHSPVLQTMEEDPSGFDQ